MAFGPAVLALVLSSTAACAITAVASGASTTVLLGWRTDRHDERQLSLERRALLVESSLKVVFGFQLISLFLFIVTVDRMHPLITGAMCAAGTLQANPFGYPALLMKVIVFLLCGVWLIVHHVTRRSWAPDIVRPKQRLVPILLLALVAECVLQWRFFLHLDPSVITSCCASIFGDDRTGLGSELAGLPIGPTRTVFFVGLLLTLLAGGRVLLFGRASGAFALLTVLLGLSSITALVTWIAPAFYELPTHHCPFCLLSARAGRVGLVLFASLAIAVVSGAGAGLVGRLRSLDVTQSIESAAERRLCAVSMSCFVLFTVVAMLPTLATGLHPEGS